MIKTYQIIKTSLIQASSWQEKYRELMLLGKQLPKLPDELKADHALVHGCDSKVWLHLEFKKASNNENETKLLIFADSDTRIVKGLLSIILSLYSDRTPSEIIAIDPEQEFEDMLLLKHLSPSRGNGIRAIIKTITEKAKELN